MEVSQHMYQGPFVSCFHFSSLVFRDEKKDERAKGRVPFTGEQRPLHPLGGIRSGTIPGVPGVPG